MFAPDIRTAVPTLIVSVTLLFFCQSRVPLPKKLVEYRQNYEGWIDKNNLQVKQEASPDSNAIDFISKRQSSEKTALMHARARVKNEIIQKLCQPKTDDCEWFVSLLANDAGKAVLTYFDDQEVCFIVYKVNIESIRKKLKQRKKDIEKAKAKEQDAKKASQIKIEVKE